MGILVKDSGVWKDSDPYVKDNGIWKLVDAAWVKDAGIWKETYSSGWVLEGSFEDGFEGWSVTQGTIVRVNNNARTGTYCLRASGSFNPKFTPTLSYTFSEEEVAAKLKLTIWSKNRDYWGAGFQTVEVYAKIGSGKNTLISSTPMDSGYISHEAVIENPDMESVVITVFHQDPESSVYFDDWKIEGTN